MILGGLSGKLCTEGLRGGKVAAQALPCKGRNGEGGVGFHRTSRGGTCGAEVSRPRSGRRSFGVAGFESCGRICVVLRWKPACVIWKGGDVRRRERCSLRERRTRRKSGERRGPAARISDGCALLGLVHRRRRREALSERENLEGGRATGRSSSRTGCRKRTGAAFIGQAAAETSAQGRHVRSRGEGAASPGMGETPGALCSVWRGARRVCHLEGGRAQTGDWRPVGDEKNAQVGGATGAVRRGPCIRDDMFPEVSGGLAVKTGRHVGVAAGDVDAFGLHAGKTGAVGQDDVVAFRPGEHDDGSPVFRASFACDVVEGRRSPPHEMSRACCLVAGGTSARASHEREKARRHVPDGPFPRRETLQKMFLRIRRLRPGSARWRVCVYACDGPRRRG